MSEGRTCCRRCGRSPSASGARVVQKIGRGTNTVCSYVVTQGFGGVFEFWGGLKGWLKKCDKTAARSDPQASLILAADGMQVAEVNVGGMKRR